MTHQTMRMLVDDIEADAGRSEFVAQSKATG